MLNRESIFAAIDALIRNPAGIDARFAVLMLQVHGLREVGLRCGYERGEQAEAAVLALIQQSLRPIDQAFHAGDDRFAVVLPAMRNDSHAVLAATRLMQAFEQPLDLGASPWFARPVIGIALHPGHGNSADPLCRNAELAQQEAWRRGEPYALHQAATVVPELHYEELRDAIEANRLRAYFQPIWNLQNGRLAGAESLARWQSTHHGEIAPTDFVPFAERNGLISALTRWSIHATLRHAAAALQVVPGLSFAINFSPRVFSRPGAVEQLIGALEIWGIPPHAVIAEITETALVEDLETSMQVLRRMRDHGVRLAIDDFGTGYASFSYLRRFPATELKIDMSLVTGMRHDPRMAKLVRAMIDMAHHLDMTAIAEGIEDQATQELLTGIGCDFGQGYHMGQPQPAGEFVTQFLPLAR
jgi:EAL domain-containing protein (putative c-di-GMP-specific phosphodiesterase class I)